MAAFNLLTLALGSWLVALLIGVVNAFAQEPWISDDANKGHLDYFFFVLAGAFSPLDQSVTRMYGQ